MDGVERPDVVIHNTDFSRLEPGYPGDSNISDQIFDIGHLFAIDTLKLEPEKMYVIEGRVNGVVTETYNKIYLKVHNSQPIMNPEIISASSTSGKIYSNTKNISVHIPYGTDKTHDWTIKVEGIESDPNITMTVEQLPDIRIFPDLGSPILDFKLFPSGNINGLQYTIQAIGTTKTAPYLTLSSNVLRVSPLALVEPAKLELQPVSWAYNTHDGDMVRKSDGSLYMAHLYRDPSIPIEQEWNIPNPVKIPIQRAGYDGTEGQPTYERTDYDPRGVEFSYASSRPDLVQVDAITYSRTYDEVSGKDEIPGVLGHKISAKNAKLMCRIPDADFPPTAEDIPVTITVTDIASDVPAGHRATPLELKFNITRFASVMGVRDFMSKFVVKRLIPGYHYGVEYDAKSWYSRKTILFSAIYVGIGVLDYYNTDKSKSYFDYNFDLSELNNAGMKAALVYDPINASITDPALEFDLDYPIVPGDYNIPWTVGSRVYPNLTDSGVLKLTMSIKQ